MPIARLAKIVSCSVIAHSRRIWKVVCQVPTSIVVNPKAAKQKASAHSRMDTVTLVLKWNADSLTYVKSKVDVH